MKKVYTTPNLLLAGHIKNLLEMQGIACRMKNAFLAGAAGELPPIECWPEIWIENDTHYNWALEVVEDATNDDDTDSTPWVCPQCQTENEGQFGLCWQCGALHPDA